MTTPDYDVVFWDDVGSPYSRALVDKKAIGGSEYAIVLLAEEFARRGLRVAAFGNGAAGTETLGYKDGRFDLTWTSVEAGTDPIKTKVLIVSRHSSYPQVDPSCLQRIAILVQDYNFYGYARSWAEMKAIDTHFSPNIMPICVSTPQRRAFDVVTPGIVIPPALDPIHYEVAEKVRRGEITKNPERFVYASAAVKGWAATRELWISLKKRHVELKNAELHVTSPGYDEFITAQDPEGELLFWGITYHPPVPPQKLSEWMADAAGLFFVNDFAETACMVACIAELVGCRMHILTQGRGRIDTFEEMLTSRLPTDKPDLFETQFLEHYRDPFLPATQAKDYSLASIADRWLDILGLPKIALAAPVGATGAKGPWGPTGMMVSTHKDVEDVFAEASPRRRPYRTPNLAMIQRVPGIPAGLTGSSYPLLGKSPVEHVSRPVTPSQVQLVIIVKNEKDVLHRALKSAEGIVDGATVVYDQMDSEVNHYPWMGDFPVHLTQAPSPYSGHAQARNEAIQIAGEFARAHLNDPYLLMLDADDTLDGFIEKDKLTADVYEIDIIDGALVYGRLSLFRPGGVTFHRRAHEYPASNGPVEKLKTLRIIRGHGGDARKVPLRKFLRDAEMLEKDWDEHHDSRSAFYLAQSYYDAARSTPQESPLASDRYRLASEWYARRARMGDWPQEVFISWMRVAQLTSFEETKIHAWLRAIETDPQRSVEVAHAALEYLNPVPRQRFALARFFADAAIRFLPDLDARERFPEGLFVDTEPYLWKFNMERSVTEWFLGQKGLAIAITEKLLASRFVPEYQKNILKDNLEKMK